MSSVQNSPVSMLSKLCSQNDIMVQYSFPISEGTTESPKFQVTVTVNDSKKTAFGSSEMFAKNKAAKSMLEKLLAVDGEFWEGFEFYGETVTVINLLDFMDVAFCGPSSMEDSDTPVSEEQNAMELTEVVVTNESVLPPHKVAKKIVPSHDQTSTADCEIKDVTESASRATGVQNTPVSLLFEFCMQHNLEANYSYPLAKGPPHEPMFQMSVIVENKEATGFGSSKKRAKHNAAKLMLEKLLAIDSKYFEGFEFYGDLVTYSNLLDIMDIACCGLSEADRDAAAAAAAAAAADDHNAMTELQELAVANQWVLPHYELEDTSGPAHDPTFTMTCKTRGFIETGIGKSKRLAKRQAAEKLLETLEKEGLKVKNMTKRRAKMLEEEEKLNSSKCNNSTESNECISESIVQPNKVE